MRSGGILPLAIAAKWYVALMSFRLKEERSGTTLLDQRTGLRFAVPPGGKLEQAGEAAGFAFCGRYRCADPAVEFRVSLKQISTEMFEAVPSLKTQLHSMCHTVATMRASGKPSITPLDPLCIKWNANAGAVAEYGKESPEDGLDLEKLVVVGRGDHVVLILMLFDSRMSPATSLQLLQGVTSTLYWPDREERPPAPSPAMAKESFFELTRDGQETRLVDRRNGFGIGAPPGGRLVPISGGWDMLYCLDDPPCLLRARLKNDRKAAPQLETRRLQLLMAVMFAKNRAASDPEVTPLDQLARIWGVDVAVLSEYPLHRPEPPFDLEKHWLFAKGDFSYDVCLTVSSRKPPQTTHAMVKAIMGSVHWPANKPRANATPPSASAGSSHTGVGSAHAGVGPARPPQTAAAVPADAASPKPVATTTKTATPAVAPDLQPALAAYNQGNISKATLMRAVTYYEGWHVPSQTSPDGSSALRMVKAPDGRWWLMLFSTKATMEAYDAANGCLLSQSFLGARGSSLINNMAGGTAGIAFDSGQPNGTFFGLDDLALLREYGQAYEIEHALAGTSRRSNPSELVCGYTGFRVPNGPDGWLQFDGDAGHRVLFVFTSEDAVEAFGKHPASAMLKSAQMVRVTGERLMDGVAEMKPAVVAFNAAGPISKVRFTPADVASWLAHARQPSGTDPLSVPRGPTSAGAKESAARPQAQADAPSPAVAAAVDGSSLRLILPQIQPYDWPGREHTVAKPIHTRIQPAGGGQTVPWVAWTFKADALTAFIGQRWLDQHRMDAPNVHSLSIRNLMGLTPSYEVIDGPPGSDAQFAFFSGEHAAEQILNPTAMNQIHERFGAAMLAVAIPVRGTLIACDARHASRLIPVARQISGSGQLPLTRMVFVVQDGVIVGKLTIGE